MGAQEATGALAAQQRRGNPVEDDRSAGDQDGCDGGIVAVDHAREATVGRHGAS